MTTTNPVLVRLALCLLAPLPARSAQGTLVDAVKTGDLAAVQALLAARADVNAAQPDGTTALHWAAHQDEVDVAQALIRAGANVKAANRYGATPLWLASVNGSAAVIALLIEAGADANAASPEGRDRA